jgi:hypothetical protein
MKGENHLSRLDESKLYDELSRSNLPATKRWYAGTGALLLVVLAAVAAFVYMMFVGLGVTGLNRPVMGVMIILFVSGSALPLGDAHLRDLRITRATWRAPVLRGPRR